MCCNIDRAGTLDRVTSNASKGPCRCVAVCCDVLRCVAVCFDVLQCVAVCCSIDRAPWYLG